MIIKPPFILDANTLIEASRRYYKFRFAQSFWDQLVVYASNGIVLSVDKVLDEFKKFEINDELKKWAENSFLPFFQSTQTSQVVMSFIEIITWVEDQSQYTRRAKDIFMGDNADAWAISYAKAHEGTVITHESVSPGAKKTIPIPNVCEAFNIPHGNTFQMLEYLNFSFK